MKLITGLGNIGDEYKNTRHNAGFMAVEKIAEVYDFEKFHSEEKFEAEISRGNIDGIDAVLIKPTTFMNGSGRAVQKIMNFYKVSSENLTVIHDDLDINLGEARSAFGRNSAGHKGVQSIIHSIGSKDFHRIRIGIKIADKKIPTEKYVLGNFDKQEAELIDRILSAIPQTIEKELNE